MRRLLKYSTVLPLCIQFPQPDNSRFNYKNWDDFEKCSTQKISEKIEVSLNEYEKTKKYCDNSFKLFLSNYCKEQLKTIDDIYKLPHLPLLTTYDNYLFSFIEKQLKKMVEEKNFDAYNMLRNFIIVNDLTTKIKDFKKYENQICDIFKQELITIIIQKDYKKFEYYFENYYKLLTEQTIKILLENIDIESDIAIDYLYRFANIEPICKSLIEKKVDEILIKYINMKDINKIKFIIDKYGKYIDISILAKNINLFEIFEYYLSKNMLVYYSTKYFHKNDIKGYKEIKYSDIRGIYSIENYTKYRMELDYTRLETNYDFFGPPIYTLKYKEIMNKKLLLILSSLYFLLNSSDYNNKENQYLIEKLNEFHNNININKLIIIILQNSYETNNDEDFIELCKKFKKLITFYDLCKNDVFNSIKINKIDMTKQRKNIFLEIFKI